MNDQNLTEGFLFPMEEKEIQKQERPGKKKEEMQKEEEETGEQIGLVPLTKYGKPDHRCKPIVREPRPDLTLEEMRTILSNIKELKTATGIKYINLRMTAKMIIGTREASGKEFTININDLFRAYQNCLRFTSPEVKKYIFMGHSPAVALLRIFVNYKEIV